jgi:hypothetical protein
MTNRNESALRGRLRRALQDFQVELKHLKAANTQQLGRGQEAANVGLRKLEKRVRDTARVVVAAAAKLSEAGFEPSADDRRLIDEARHHLGGAG